MTQTTSEKINAKLDEVGALSRELDNLPYGEGGYLEKEGRVEELRDEIYLLSKEFKNSDVIKTLERMSDEYISPEGALGRWVHSWC